MVNGQYTEYDQALNCNARELLNVLLYPNKHQKSNETKVPYMEIHNTWKDLPLCEYLDIQSSSGKSDSFFLSYI